MASRRSPGQAIGHKTGARRLRAILEDTLLDVMFELPSIPNVAKCILDSDAFQDDTGVSLELDGRRDCSSSRRQSLPRKRRRQPRPAAIDDTEDYHPAAS